MREKRTMKPAALELTSVTVWVQGDENADFSHYGTYTDDVTDPWHILRASGGYVHDLPEEYEMPPRGREYRAFKPYAGGMRPGSQEYREYGLQDFARMEALERGEWSPMYVHISATVTLPSGRTVTVRTPGVGGIESDSLDGYVQEIAEDERPTLTEDLAALGIDKATVDAAWARRETKWL